jgi:glycine cleavage system H protein
LLSDAKRLSCAFTPKRKVTMSTPTDRRFSETHEWFKLEGDTLTIGLSQFAVNELTDITYVEMKPVGTELEAGDAVGEVESVKTTSDVYSVCAGEIIALNDALEDDPSVMNSDPYGEGWLVKIKTTDASPLDGLLATAAYDEQFPVS